MRESMLYVNPNEKAPGLVLGPYEAMLAMSAWMHEALPQSGYSYGPVQKLMVSSVMKEQLLTGYLLYGRLDAHSAMPFFDSYLFSHGFQESRREIVGDFLLDAEAWSPFTHTLESGFLWPMLQPKPKLSAFEWKKLVTPCFKALDRAGLKGYTPWEPGAKFVPLRERLNQSVDNILACLSYEMNPEPTQCTNTLNSLVYAIDRSTSLQIPFYSRDAAAPAWIRKDRLAESRIVRIVFEEVDWLPRPRTFKEAFAMVQDGRIGSLRNTIKDLQEKIVLGDIDGQAELRDQIRQDVKQFRNKSWAGKAAKMLAYAAVPAEIAGLLCETHVVGISVAGLGATCEWISTLASKRKSKHWLSMSRIPGFLR